MVLRRKYEACFNEENEIYYILKFTNQQNKRKQVASIFSEYIHSAIRKDHKRRDYTTADAGDNKHNKQIISTSQ